MDAVKIKRGKRQRKKRRLALTELENAKKKTVRSRRSRKKTSQRSVDRSKDQVSKAAKGGGTQNYSPCQTKREREAQKIIRICFQILVRSPLAEI